VSGQLSFSRQLSEISRQLPDFSNQLSTISRRQIRRSNGTQNISSDC
jgi:hypothetical protein